MNRCRWAKGPLMIRYHDTEWGIPTRDDRKLYEMLLLEAFQAGLSWHVVLSKRENFRRAFDGFDPHKIAQYGEDKIASLLSDAGLIRCRRKLEGAVCNARCFLAIQQEFGSFSDYIWGWTDGEVICENDKTTSELSDKISKNLKKRGMTFVGSTIIYSYLQAIGVINSQEEGCWKYENKN